MVNTQSFVRMQDSRIFDKILSHTVVAGKVRYLLGPKTVYEFLANYNAIRKIPDYQRPYSWDDKNVLALLSDINNLTNSKESSWFLGPVFTTKETEEDLFSNILDGQQRLTTIQIILREAALLKVHCESVDWSENKKLEKDLDELIANCNTALIKQGFPTESRFKTEESIAEIFDKYILSIKDIYNVKDYIENQKSFFKELDRQLINGSKTSGRIKKSIEVVTSFFKEKILEKSPETINNLKHYKNFITALLNQCWLIEIPLQEDDLSIQIFESINNRGKNLSLVDKLRYKCLVNCQEKNKETIKNKWKEIYSGLEFIEEAGYIKSDDDFFKVFFNSLDGNDITKENSFIEIFEKWYLKDDSTILEFIEETIKILNFHKHLNEALDEKNIFIEKNFKKEDHVKIRALFQLFRNTLKISDNSRFLFYNLIRRNNFKGDIYDIPSGLWTIIRIFFYKEVFTVLKSNQIRTDYKKIISEIQKGAISLSDYDTKMNLKLAGKSLMSLLKTSNNNEARFILYLWSYLKAYESLTTMAPSAYKTSNLEHMFPRSWKENWGDKTYKRENIINHLDGKDPNDFPVLDLNQLKNELKSLEDIELRVLGTNDNIQDNSLIEFIGNKWVIHGSTNKGIRNYDFSLKKDKLKLQKYIKLPNNEDKRIGLDNYQTFGYENILDRSLIIMNDILLNFHMEWKDIAK